ncbi:hypothetical protein AAFN90_09010 [Erwiniaceae bacterium CAU 1747]
MPKQGLRGLGVARWCGSRAGVTVTLPGALAGAGLAASLLSGIRVV